MMQLDIRSLYLLLLLVLSLALVGCGGVESKSHDAYAPIEPDCVSHRGRVAANGRFISHPNAN
jgi:serine protease inhibitor